ncbi:DNA methylase [Pontimonas phage phiPsal1]|nr:DNA methylase [Pontimonas phage phiPsal1]
MEPKVVVDGARVFLGDCRQVLKTLPDNSVNSVVTDPPYELGFMGKKWDSSGIAYDVTVWAECLRVLKPGGHVLAFGGSRTWHRLAVAIEDAGFELRDSIAWIYGQGFPKSMDVSKAIDKRAGVEREVIGQGKSGKTAIWNEAGEMGNFDLTAPATSEAQKWQGWGTALKPAFEPVVVGRKPLVGTVAENVLAWGVGGLNIDGSRIGSEIRTDTVTENGFGSNFMDDNWKPSGKSYEKTVQGRWPANVILDEVTAGLLDEQTGVLKSGAVDQSKITAENRIYGALPKNRSRVFEASEGGASRFFYQAKASKRDRNEGLEDLEQKAAGSLNMRTDGHSVRNGRNTGARSNHHPTVKPTALMRYLIKLVTPPGGTVLDPFTGSGSTGKAALLDGFEFVGAELTEDYLPIIEGRLKWAVENREEESLF